ncbi:MAG TPA: cation diffusion facilitator family transporter [Kofleriaceae bacterium]|jgi:cation diffusion facilitator family transporter|nr:cation diffusion facilitator family transporter [Kofleriaceae bacterium]
MAGNGEGTGYILRALGANFAIACAKGVGAFVTGSGAMLAETLHSLSDCVNQLLLLLGLRQARRPPSEQYPLGQGRNLYFWSFMVAMLLFLGGGTYSIYEGIHKLQHPSPLESPHIAIGILAFALVVEGWAMAGAYKAVNARKGDRSLIQYLRETKDSDLVVIFGEDGAAVLGLALALIAIVVAWVTGNPMFDAIGTLCIGTVLIAVAIFLAAEVKSLLLGEAADPRLVAEITAAAGEDQRIIKVLRALTVQQGPGEVMVACKLQFVDKLGTQELVASINAFEQRLQAKVPEVKWCFIEPDISD